MEIMVNGEPRQVDSGATVATLLTSLGLRPSTVAVELDREIVPRARYADTPLRDGAEVEIVTFVGGG